MRADPFRERVAAASIAVLALACGAHAADDLATDAAIRRWFFDEARHGPVDQTGGAWVPETQQDPSNFPIGSARPASADTLEEARELVLQGGCRITSQTTTDVAFEFEGAPGDAWPRCRVWRTDFYRPLRTHRPLPARQAEPLGVLREPTRANAERLAALLWEEIRGWRGPAPRVMALETIETDRAFRVVRTTVGPTPNGGAWNVLLEPFEVAVDRRDGSVTRRKGPAREIAAPCPDPIVSEPGRTPEGLAIDVRVDRDAVTPGARPAANVTVTLTNVTGDDVWMDFPNPCFPVFRVERPNGARLRYEEMTSLCIQVSGALRLRAGETYEKTQSWSARDDQSRPFEPGAYAIVGVLQRHGCGSGELPESASRPVPVEVLAAR